MKLPAEFVEHALSHEMPAALPGFDANDCGDDEYWRDWSKSVRNSGFVAALGAAKVEADRLAAVDQAAYLEKTVREYEASHGLSDRRRQWRECERMTLRERAFCAIHMGAIPLHSPRQSEFYCASPLLKSYFAEVG